jgi:hypothetical protein
MASPVSTPSSSSAWPPHQPTPIAVNGWGPAPQYSPSSELRSPSSTTFHATTGYSPSTPYYYAGANNGTPGSISTKPGPLWVKVRYEDREMLVRVTASITFADAKKLALREWNSPCG